jgi:hypothetical protein
MKRLLPLILTIAMIATAAFGADLAGHWTGTIAVPDPGSGTTITTQVHVELSQQGDVIAGKIGRIEDNDVVAIKNGHMDGDTFTFEAASEETSGAMKFTLKIQGDRMEGTMKGSIDSGDINGKVKLSRDKSGTTR